MTTEQMLKKIIEAQVKGGFDGFTNFREPTVKWWIGSTRITMRLPDDLGYQSYAILEILLDSKGLRAAYGEKLILPYEGGGDGDIASTQYAWEINAIHILRSWLTTPEGNTEAAIKTAFDLLPQA